MFEIWKTIVPIACVRIGVGLVGVGKGMSTYCKYAKRRSIRASYLIGPREVSRVLVFPVYFLFISWSVWTVGCLIILVREVNVKPDLMLSKVGTVDLLNILCLLGVHFGPVLCVLCL